MKHTQASAVELACLLRLLPALHELDTIDKIYRLLLAVATCGREVGFARAMLFVVDEKQSVVRGLYGIDRVESGHKLDPGPPTIEGMARDVFDVYEDVEATDATLRVKSFSVPLAWHRSAIVKAARGGVPVLAQRGLSEYATDTFFEFFASERYVAVPVKLQDTVAAVITADNGPEHDWTADDISLLCSLTHQAETAADHRLAVSDHGRKARILWKIHHSLALAKNGEQLDNAVRLALIMLTRALGGTGCVLRDFTRQKSLHIKTVQEFATDADDDDIRITHCFEDVLDRVAGTAESITGDGSHPYLGGMVVERLHHFYATPLASGDDVSGAVAVYTERDSGARAKNEFASDDKAFFKVCAGVIATHLEGRQKEVRLDRIENFLTELSTHLAKEREQSRLGERASEYQASINRDLRRLRELLKSRAAYAKRFAKIRAIVDEMQETAQQYKREADSTAHYEMTDIFELVRSVADEWRESATRRGVRMTVRVPTTGPKLLVDRDRIASAVGNVLGTTSECLKEGDSMLVECSATDTSAVICVADNGRGVPGDAISRLFMPFETIDAPDEHKRALSLAGDIIQKHGGEIIIKSSRSWKTILVLTLPLAANRDRRKLSGDRRGRGDRRLRVGSK